MDPNPDRKASVSLRFTTVSVPPDGLSAVPCLRCEKLLDIHQPNPEQPERILATCEACKRWYLVDCNPEGTEAVVVTLPPPETFREVLER